jgi:hypothetical protein
MSEKPPSKDEALEALDFIVNVLKEHEKDLDRLVSELGTVADQLGENGETNGKVKKIEDKITNLQTDIGNLMKSMSRPEPAMVQAPMEAPNQQPKVAAPSLVAPSGLPLTFQCSQWDDFQTLANNAQTVSFTFSEAEKRFQVTALKNNQVISFNGELPKLSALLKIYLGKQMTVSEKQILEGIIALK